MRKSAGAVYGAPKRLSSGSSGRWSRAASFRLALTPLVLRQALDARKRQRRASVAERYSGDPVQRAGQTDFSEAGELAAIGRHDIDATLANVAQPLAVG